MRTLIFDVYSNRLSRHDLKAHILAAVCGRKPFPELKKILAFSPRSYGGPIADWLLFEEPRRLILEEEAELRVEAPPARLMAAAPVAVIGLLKELLLLLV